MRGTEHKSGEPTEVDSPLSSLDHCRLWTTTSPGALPDAHRPLAGYPTWIGIVRTSGCGGTSFGTLTSSRPSA